VRAAGTTDISLRSANDLEYRTGVGVWLIRHEIVLVPAHPDSQERDSTRVKKRDLLDGQAQVGHDVAGRVGVVGPECGYG
jgi:hypothetical protein